MIVYHKDMVLSPVTGVSDKPWFGWRSVITPTNIAASSEAVGFPALNLANPSTADRWVAADETEQTLTVTLTTPDLIDYLAIARHNFQGRTIWAEGRRIDTDPYSLLGEIIPGDNTPILFRFPAQSFFDIRLRIAAASPAADLAVMYVGKLMQSPSGIQPSYSPLAFARQTTVINGISEGGEYLGEITTRSMRGSGFSMTNLPEDWCRGELIPFLDRSPRNAFFFAWKPQTYPNDIGYAWAEGDPAPEMYHPDGRMQISMSLRAIA